MDKITTVRLDEALAGRVDQLAASLDRPKTWVIAQAVKRYVDQEAWQVQAIQEAMDSFDMEKAQGHVEAYDLDDVMNEMDAIIRDNLPRP